MNRHKRMNKGSKINWGSKRLLAFLLALAMIAQPILSSVGTLAYAEETTEAAAAVSDTQDTVEAPQPAAEPVAEPAAEPVAPSEDVSSDTASDQTDIVAPAEQPAADQTADAEKEKDDAGEDEEDKMPAQSFSGSVNGIIVNVTAPEGALPEETKMTVTAIDAASAARAAERVLDGDVSKVNGANISFYNKEGAEIEPEKAVSVSMIVPGMDAEAKKSVVHIDDSGVASQVPAVVSGSGNASFAAKDFSVYIVVDEEDPSADENAVATYEFYVGKEKKNTQSIKSGDDLVDPGPLGAGNGATSIFKGWYVDSEGSYTGETAGQPLVFGTRTTVPKTETIKIVAKIETTYYVTFFGEKDADGNRGIVAVDTVTVEGEEGTSGTLDISSKSVLPKADTSVFEGWAESETAAEAGTVITGSSITVNAKKELYAVVSEANWIHFDENVTYPADSDPDYTGPVYVKKTDDLSTKKPNPDPERDGYSFGGWYTDKKCTNLFQWTGTGLEQDIILFAKWVPAETTYSVVIWKQKVTDAKDAQDDAKKYDFEESEPKTGTTGQTLNETDFTSYTEYDYTGFHYGRIEIDPISKTVNANGTTVVNVYYDRDLMTIRFVDGTHTQYEETTSNSGQQYGKIGDNYVALTRSGNQWTGYTYTYQKANEYTGTTYRQASGTSGTQYGFVNGQMVQLTRRNGNWYYNGNTRYYGRNRYFEGATGSSGYGVVNGEVVGISRGEEGEWVYTTTETYTGTRYITVQEPNVTEYTGLYGSSLGANTDEEGNPYKWPEERDWYQNPNGGGTRLTFLDAFKFEGLSGVSEGGTVLTQYGRTPSGTGSIRFYKQNVDGTWPTTATNTVSSNNGTFTITEKYEGFKAVSYRNTNGGAWTNAGAGTSGISTNNLQIRFERQKYSLTFIADGEIIGEPTQGIPYEDALSKYKIDDPEKQHYEFVCWCEDPEGVAEVDWNSTMPAANKVVYAKFSMVQYHVSLDPAGGVIDEEYQDSEFNIDPHKVLDKDALFRYTTWEDGSHELVGWFYKDGPNAGKVYDYGEVLGPVNLIAIWRIPGQVVIEYDAGEGGSGAPIDPYKYATDSSVVLGAPPTTINKNYTFVGWKLQKEDGSLDDTIYYAGNTFTITEDFIQDYDTETKTGKIKVKAVYNKAGEGPYETTYIRWFKNDGTPCFHVDKLEIPEEGDYDLDDSTLRINEAVAIQGAPTRDGYDFLGWAKVEEGDSIALEQELTEANLFIKYDGGVYKSNATDEPCTQIAADNVIVGDRKYEAMFAVWCLKKYTVVYTDGVEGEAFVDETHPNLTVENTTPEYNDGTDPKRDGYDFDGWDPAYTTKLAVDKADSNNVITYTAKWKEKEEEVKINYESADTTMGSVDPASETVPLTGEATGSKATPAEGYEFVNWTKGTEVVSTNATFKPEKVDGKNVAATYTAHFQEKETATITYKLGGGNYGGNTDDIEETHDIGDVITIRNAPTRDGYTFLYWDGSTLYPGDKYTVEGDHTFTAMWVQNITPPTPPTPPTPTPTPTPTITPTVTPTTTPTITPAVIEDTPTPQATIEPEPTPQATIEDKAAPKAAPEEDYWALINLLCTIATCLISVLLLVFYFIKRKADEDEQQENSNSRAAFMNDDQEEAERHNKLGMRLLGLIPAIGSVIAFILTEDMSLPMKWVDKWTLMMVIILAIEAALAIFSKKTTDDGEEEQQGQPARA